MCHQETENIIYLKHLILSVLKNITFLSILKIIIFLYKISSTNNFIFLYKFSYFLYEYRCLYIKMLKKFRVVYSYEKNCLWDEYASLPIQNNHAFVQSWLSLKSRIYFLGVDYKNQFEGFQKNYNRHNSFKSDRLSERDRSITSKHSYLKLQKYFCAIFFSNCISSVDLKNSWNRFGFFVRLVNSKSRIYNWKLLLFFFTFTLGNVQINLQPLWLFLFIFQSQKVKYAFKVFVFFFSRYAIFFNSKTTHTSSNNQNSGHTKQIYETF